MSQYRISESLAHFARRGVEKFDGMLNKSAAVTAAAATTIKGADHGWDGRAFLEIGVYKGKFFSLIESATKGSDLQLIGVDPFSMRGQSKADVEQKFLEEGLELDRIKLYQGFSSDQNLIRDAIGDRKLTLCHIDGSHKEADVYSDFHMIEKLISDDAIVIGDDFWNRSQLGVTTAIFRFVIEDKIDLKPMMISNTKIYLCREDKVKEYQRKFIDCFKANLDFTLFSEWVEKREKSDRWHTEQLMSKWPVLLV